MYDIKPCNADCTAINRNTVRKPPLCLDVEFVFLISGFVIAFMTTILLHFILLVAEPIPSTRLEASLLGRYWPQTTAAHAQYSPDGRITDIYLSAILIWPFFIFCVLLARWCCLLGLADTYLFYFVFYRSISRFFVFLLARRMTRNLHIRPGRHTKGQYRLWRAILVSLLLPGQYATTGRVKSSCPFLPYSYFGFLFYWARFLQLALAVVGRFSFYTSCQPGCSLHCEGCPFQRFFFLLLVLVLFRFLYLPRCFCSACLLRFRVTIWLAPNFDCSVLRVAQTEVIRLCNKSIKLHRSHLCFIQGFSYHYFRWLQ